jgi:serine/threonine protein phosphatase PrpC
MAKLYLQRDQEKVDTTDIGLGQVAAFSRASPAKSTPNEDASLVLAAGPETVVLAVADGVGGCRAGHVAARMAVQSLQESLARTGPSERTVRAAILDGIELANQRILEQASGSASTLAVVEIDGRSVRPYHVGDSMILVIGGRGKIKYQTISHSPVGFAVEAGLLDEDQALHHEDRHVVSNFVGSQEMRIEVGPTLQLTPQDRVLLASDGLFDNLTIDEVVALARKGPLRRAVRELSRQVHQRMTCPADGLPSKPDDTTILVYRPTRRPLRGSTQ